MLRPICVIGFSYISGLFIASFFSTIFNIIIFFVMISTFCILLILLNFKYNIRILTIILSFSLAILVYLLYTISLYNNVISIDGNTSEITAVVTDKFKKADNSYYYRVKTKSIEIENVRQNIDMILYTNDIVDLDYYDEINLKVNFNNYNKDKLAINDYNRSNGIYIYSNQADYSEIKINNNIKKPFYYNIIKLRNFMKLNIDNYIKDENISGVVKALLFGEKDYISYNTYTSFKKSGILHIFAVSGFHLTVLVFILYKFLSIFRLNKRIIYFIICIFILLFMAISGFSNSIFRAGIMSIIFCISKIFFQKVDSLNSLSISGIILVLLNPYTVFNASFLLTFSASLGIIFFNMKLSKLIDLKFKYNSKIILYIIKSISFSTIILLFTLPFNIILFKNISLISPFINLVITPLIYIILPISFIISIFGGITQLYIFFNFLSTPIILLVNIILYITNSISKTSLLYIPLGFDFIFIWLIFSIILIFISILSRLRLKMLLLSCIMSIIILFTGIITNYIFLKDILKINIISEGYGKSVVCTYNGRSIVIGCGGNDYIATSIMDYLDSIGIYNIDLLILPKLNKTISRAAPILLDRYKVNFLLSPSEGNMYESVVNSISSETKLVVLDNMEIKLNNDIYIKFENINNSITNLKFLNSNIIISWSIKDIIDYNNSMIILFDDNYNLLDKLRSNFLILGKYLDNTVISNKNIVKAYENRYTIFSIRKDGNFSIRSIK